MFYPRTIAVAVGLCASFFGTAWGQIDYRNLDDDRPVVTEDAYPVERYAFEVLGAYRFESEVGGGQHHVFVPEAAYGLARNAQIGLKLPFVGADEGTGTNSGLAGLRIFGLYNFNTEGRWLLALSLRTDVSFPVGALAGEGSRFALKAIATTLNGANPKAHLEGHFRRMLHKDEEV